MDRWPPWNGSSSLDPDVKNGSWKKAMGKTFLIGGNKVASLYPIITRNWAWLEWDFNFLNFKIRNLRSCTSLRILTSVLLHCRWIVVDHASYYTHEQVFFFIFATHFPGIVLTLNNNSRIIPKGTKAHTFIDFCCCYCC